MIVNLITLSIYILSYIFRQAVPEHDAQREPQEVKQATKFCCFLKSPTPIFYSKINSANTDKTVVVYLALFSSGFPNIQKMSQLSKHYCDYVNVT